MLVLTKKNLLELLEQAMIEGAEGLHLDGVIHATEILEGWMEDDEAETIPPIQEFVEANDEP